MIRYYAIATLCGVLSGNHVCINVTSLESFPARAECLHHAQSTTSQLGLLRYYLRGFKPDRYPVPACKAVGINSLK